VAIISGERLTAPQEPSMRMTSRSWRA
jgi:hypothetical protein